MLQQETKKISLYYYVKVDERRDLHQKNDDENHPIYEETMERYEEEEIEK